MAVLVEVPVEDGAVLVVEADRQDLPGRLVLASTPKPGEVAARATRSLGESLEQLEPTLRTIKEKLLEHAPDHFSVEFGVKLGGETGVILAKGTAEVNLKMTMTWDRP
jgi:hypothetical protein